jgi:hypothetical protein
MKSMSSLVIALTVSAIVILIAALAHAGVMVGG